jgi:hypothetical protein
MVPGASVLWRGFILSGTSQLLTGEPFPATVVSNRILDSARLMSISLTALLSLDRAAKLLHVPLRILK